MGVDADLLFLGRENLVLLLQAGNDAVDSCLKILDEDRRLVMTSSDERGLIAHVR